MAITKLRRPKLEELDLSLGKKTRLYRLMFQYGPANGTLLFLPVDQGLEHGPRDFFANPESIDPEFQLRIAKEGRYSGVVFHIGIAQKYLKEFAGQVPLVLKLNGKTDIPSDRHAFSGQTASVEEAVRLGADAVGYTLYVGSDVPDIIEGSGSGFFVEKGLILTNEHVIRGGTNIVVVMNDGSRQNASVVATNAELDLALLQVPPRDDQVVVTLGSSSTVKVGQKAIVIGNPYGLEHSVTTGVISGTGRALEPFIFDGDVVAIPQAMQTDAAINPGNSGGPIFNSSGEVIGVATSILSPTGSFVGIGLALPIDLAKEALPKMMAQIPSSSRSR